MAQAKTLTQGIGFARPNRPSEHSSAESIAAYIDEVIRLFLSDLAAHIKQLRRTQRSRSSKLVVQFFQALAKSSQPITDLSATGIDLLRDFADFLQSTRQSLRDDLMSGHLKAHDVLTQSLEPTAQFLSDSLKAIEARKDVAKALSDYIEQFERLQYEDAAFSSLPASPETTEKVTVSLPAFSAVPKRARPYFVKDTCNPDFGISFTSLFSYSFSLPAATFANGKKASRTHRTAPLVVTRTSTAETTPPAIRQFVRFIAEHLDQLAQRESISHLVLRTFTKLSNSPDIFADLSTLSFISGISDFKDFLESQKSASESKLSREIASEVATYLLGLFNTAMNNPATVAQLTDYAESAPVEPDEVLSLLDKAAPPPLAEPESAELPKVSDITHIVQDLEPVLPDTLPAESAEPTEAQYIQYVTEVLTRVKAQTSPDSVGHRHLSELLSSPDILAALSQTEHEWLKEFANFIGESWLQRTPLAKLQALSDEIVSSLSTALSAQTDAPSAQQLDAELDELLSTLKPPPLPEEEPLPTLPPAALEELAQDIESAIALPDTATSSPSAEISETADSTTTISTSSLIESARSELSIPDAPALELPSAVPASEDAAISSPDEIGSLSDALASLADSNELTFQMDSSAAADMPDYLALALDTLRQVRLTLPRTDAGEFAANFFETILASDDFLGALQTSSLSPIRDIGNYILSANQSQPKPEAFKASLMTKVNEAIGLLFSEFERLHAEQELSEEIDFLPTDFILPDEALDVDAPASSTLPNQTTSPDTELFVHAATTTPPTEFQDELLLPPSESLIEPLPELTDELFKDLDVLADSPTLSSSEVDLHAPAVSPTSQSTPVADTPALENALTYDSALHFPDEPQPDNLLLSDCGNLATQENDLALLDELSAQVPTAPEPEQSVTPSPDTGAEDSLLLQDDLLASELLLDESALSDTALSDSDMRTQELSSLYDLSAKNKPADTLSEQAIDDTLLFLDDSAFLNSDLLLDDTAGADTASTQANATEPSASASAAPQEPQLASSESLLDFSSTDLTLDDSLTAPPELGSTGDAMSEVSTDLAPPAVPMAESTSPATKFVPDELQQIFLEEATEYLEKLNEDLLELDKFADTQQPELVNRVLRGSHTIKGSAAMVQLRNISDLAHKMEDSLQLVRDRNLKAPKPLIDVLFQAADAIGAMLNTFRNTGKDEHPKKDELVSILKNYTDQLDKFGTITASGTPEPTPKFVPNELQQIFLEEATEYLEKLNEDLLELDKFADTQQPELVNRVLRGSHTIKGSAAMVQLRNISDLAHKMEDSLQLVRDRNLKAPKPLIDVLFQAADAIGA
ncbi:MAG: Hpt domain-containing protein, partial [Chloroherpetonaceae bacterium]|nr:Hpt domain-containing protein [Chloroherpetonaceae bacterium]